MLLQEEWDLTRLRVSEVLKVLRVLGVLKVLVLRVRMVLKVRRQGALHP